MNLLLPLRNNVLAKAQVDAVVPYLLKLPRTVVLASIVERPLVQSGRYGYNAITDKWLEEDRRLAKRLVERWSKSTIEWCPRVHVQTVVAVGDPLSELIRLQHDLRIDMIILAQHEKHPLRRIFEPSFCEKLAASAKCRTLITLCAGHTGNPSQKSINHPFRCG